MHGTGLSDGDDGGRHLSQEQKICTGRSGKQEWLEGTLRKGISLLIVLVAYRLDLIAGTDFICNAVMAAYLVNELLSITENLGLMGVPVPKVLTSAIDLLRQKSEAQETNKMQRAKGELVEAGEKEQKHQEREYQKREEKEL